VFVWGKYSKHGNEPVHTANVCPPIVDRGTLLRVPTLMKERMPKRVNPRRVSSPFLLSGLAFCGHCGKALVGKYAKSGEFAYYVCGTLLKKGAGSCPTRYLNSQQFENLVIGKIKEHVLTTDNLTKLVEMINEEMDGLATEYNERLHIVTAELADVNTRLERLYDVVETGQIQLADLVPRIQQLRHRQEQLQAGRLEMEQQLSDRRVELADEKTVSSYVSDLHNLLNESSLTEKKSFVRSFVKEVKVTEDEVLLTYTIPM